MAYGSPRMLHLHATASLPAFPHNMVRENSHSLAILGLWCVLEQVLPICALGSIWKLRGGHLCIFPKHLNGIMVVFSLMKAR
jgi:hypothetical protein